MTLNFQYGETHLKLVGGKNDRTREIEKVNSNRIS